MLQDDVTHSDDVTAMHSDNNTSTTEQKAVTAKALPDDCRTPVFSVHERQLGQQNSNSGSSSSAKQLQQSPDATTAADDVNDVYDCPRTPSLPEWSLSNTTRAYLHKDDDDIDANNNNNNSILNRSNAVPLMNIQRLMAGTGVTVKSVTADSGVLNDSTQHNRSDAAAVQQGRAPNYSDESKIYVRHIYIKLLHSKACSLYYL
jgi:hypothetical protein